MLPGQLRKLSGVLQNGWSPDCSRPVVVVVALFVGHLGDGLEGHFCLRVVVGEGLVLGVVVDQPVLAGTDCPGLRLLGHQVEVDLVVAGQLVVDDRSGFGVVISLLADLALLLDSLHVEPRVDFLVDGEKHDFGTVGQEVVQLFAGVPPHHALNDLEFAGQGAPQLRVRQPFAVDDESVGKAALVLEELPDPVVVELFEDLAGEGVAVEQVGLAVVVDLSLYVVG